MVVVLVILAFIAVFAVTVIALTIHNAKQADKLAKLEEQKQALTLLAHAMEYLTKEGIGYNLEWTSARVILETAMYNVLYT